VFVTLYAAGGAVSVKDIGRRLGFTTEMVNKYVYNMISKGVPVLRSQEQGDMFIDLNPDFRTLQAKQNVVQVDDGIRRQVRTQEI
jgi:biotin operon repressor